MSSAKDLLASVAALKSLAAPPAEPIIPPMRKTAQAVPAPIPGGWRKPAPPAPETNAWSSDDLRNWRQRIGGVTQDEAALLMGLSKSGYIKMELCLTPVRLSYVLLARYIERFGPLS